MTIPLRCGVLARKVPDPTPGFWGTKILSTAMGEAVSDYLVHAFNPVLAVGLGAVALVLSLVWQFRVKRYLPYVYWLAVAMVAIAGTMAADVLHVQFHVPYLVSSVLFAVVLAGVFYAWGRTEKTLSIHSIFTPRREVFYWLTVMATFALGTAAGDLTAITFNLGYFGSGVMFAVLIVLPLIAWRYLRFNSIAAFWISYVITRPLGASFADWLDKPRPPGLAIGNGPVGLYLTAVLVLAVGVLTLTWNRSQPAETAPDRAVRIGAVDTPPDRAY
jgi:uncharacterized membrane-anchored protein